MQKRTFKNLAAVVGLSTSLNMMGCVSKTADDVALLSEDYHKLVTEYHDLKREYARLKDKFVNDVNTDFSTNQLYCIVTVSDDGSLEYHLVTKRLANFNEFDTLSRRDELYLSITEPPKYFVNQIFHYGNGYSYESVSQVYRTHENGFLGFIPDYNAPLYVVNYFDLPLPDEYIDKETYSLEEVTHLEDYLNDLQYATDKWQDSTYDVTKLAFVKVGDTGFMIDMHNYLELKNSDDPNHQESVKYIQYFYAITNPVRGLKIISDLSTEEYDNYNIQGKKIESLSLEITSLDKDDVILGKDWKGIEIAPYLDEMFKGKTKLTYDEVSALEEAIITSLKLDSNKKLTK